MRRSVVVLLALLWLPARGSVVRALDLPDLCRGADVVVHGVVIEARSGWEGKRIITRVTIGIAETLKGAPGARVTVRRLGGVVGGVGQSVAGEAALAPGDEVVLFLARKPDGYVMLGMSQGVYRVSADARTGERRARRELEGLALVRGAGAAVTEPAAAPSVALAELLVEVRRLVR